MLRFKSRSVYLENVSAFQAMHTIIQQSMVLRKPTHTIKGYMGVNSVIFLNIKRVVGVGFHDLIVKHSLIVS